MTDYIILHERAENFPAEVIAALREMEAARERETLAAIRIQKHWRGFVVRRNLQKLEGQVLLIQRCFRGFLGRERARARQRERNEELRQAYFLRAATDIQRFWRGYVVRSRVLDFAKRKQFLSAVQRQNRKTRAEAQAELESTVAAMSQEQERRDHEALFQTLSRMNHMVSTLQREGPLRAPMLGSIGLDSSASISGRPVEAVIRDTARMRRFGGGEGQGEASGSGALPPLTMRSKASLMRTGNPKDSALYRTTIRGSEAYGEEQRTQVIADRAKKRALVSMHGKLFTSGPRVYESRTAPLAASLPYRDPVDYVLKGVRTAEPEKELGPQFKSAIHSPGVFDESMVA